MADSPRTDISADADTDDKNQRVFLLSPPLCLSLSRSHLGAILLCNLGNTKYC